jgi:methyl halide transferase
MTVINNWWDNYWITFLDQIPWESNCPDINLVKYLEKASPNEAIDVGCGSGINSNYIYEKGINVIGIDISTTALGLAKERYPNVQFETGDVLCLKIEKKFDFVFDKGCFHVFNNKEEREMFAKSVSNLLTENGVWLSIIGSAEALHTQENPPKRTLKEIVESIEPYLTIDKIESTYIQTNIHNISDKIITDNGKILAYAVYSKARNK